MNQYNLILLLFAFVSTVTSAQPASAWENLFNGKNFDGWAVIERPVNAVIQDSSIVLHMTAHTSRHSFIRTNKKYKDFIFEVDYRRDSIIDSGILFRGHSTPDTAFSALFGYMVKVDPSPTRRWTGGVFLDFGNGINWLHSLENDDRARCAEKPGQWNQVRIEAIGNHIKVFVNGIPTVNMIDDRYQEGFIAFKIHFLMGEVEKEKLQIAYKNARIITKGVQKYAQATDLPLRDTRKKVDITYFR